MNDTLSLISEITTRLGNSSILQTQATADGTLTLWVKGDQAERPAKVFEKRDHPAIQHAV